jgi:hypothetical protein
MKSNLGVNGNEALNHNEQNYFENDFLYFS